MHLFDYLDSGNGYKVRLLLAQLGQKYQWSEVDIDKGDTRTAGIPQAQSQRPHSHAAARRRHLPAGIERHPLVSRRRVALRAGDADRPRPGAAVDVLRAVQPRALCRHAALHLPAFPRRPSAPRRVARPAGERVARPSRSWSSTFRRRQFFVNDRYSIADIALYAYSHVAEDGGHDLEGYPNVREWLGRVAAQPGYVPLLARPR